MKNFARVCFFECHSGFCVSGRKQKTNKKNKSNNDIRHTTFTVTTSSQYDIEIRSAKVEGLAQATFPIHHTTRQLFSAGKKLVGGGAIFASVMNHSGFLVAIS